MSYQKGERCYAVVRYYGQWYVEQVQIQSVHEDGTRTAVECGDSVISGEVYTVQEGDLYPYSMMGYACATQDRAKRRNAEDELLLAEGEETKWE